MCGIMRGGKIWHTENYVRDIASRCVTLKEFKDNHDRAYRLARRWGIIDEFNLIRCERGASYWPEQRIRDVASKYQSLSEFRKKQWTAHSYAVKMGINKDLGFKPIGNRMKRCVYVFEFQDKCVYVGLTWNADLRKNQHLSNNKSPVYAHQCICKDYIFTIKENYISCKDAQKYEDFYINEYRQNGWILLNKRCGGALGGGDSKITDDMIKKESLKYRTRIELSKNNYTYYIIALERGLLNELFGSRYIEYDINEIKQIASNYKMRSKFKAEHPGLYRYLSKCGRLDELFPIVYNGKGTLKKSKIYKKDIEMTDNANIKPIYTPQRQRYNTIYPITL